MPLPGYPGYPPPGYGPPPGWPQPSYPPPSYPPQVYPPQVYPPQVYPPPGWAPPSYPPPAHGPPPGYPPAGYGPPPGYPPVALKPGVIPLRPMSLTDIFNGAVGYIRANPKATLGLTAAVVVLTQIVTLIPQIGPFAFADNTVPGSSGEPPLYDVAGWALLSIGGVIVTLFGGVVLGGMLTVVVGRAVFASSISISEAWNKVRGRLLALIGLAALEAVGGAMMIGAVALIVLGTARVVTRPVAVIVCLPMVLGLALAIGFLYTVLSFAPPLIVLERLPIFAAIRRSFALVRNSFWRVLGILALTGVIAQLVAAAVAFPFALGGQLLALGTAVSLGHVVSAVGAAIGRIITAPFSAGVLVLLYTDRRIRSEAFDLVLQTGVVADPAAVESTDSLWLTRPV